LITWWRNYLPMHKASFNKYQLVFKSPVLTSRGAMNVKNGYFLYIKDGSVTGTGECSYIEGLSMDDLDSYEDTLRLLCRYIETGGGEPLPDLSKFPSIRFGWEAAQIDLQNGGRKILFQSDFTAGKASIPINGLVWMGDKEFMHTQIRQKIDDGCRCIKLKVGAIDFDDELALLQFIRSKFLPDELELRLDANGAFNTNEVFEKLEVLSKFHIHSIEQPIKAGQLEWMKKVCTGSPIPVALDEELINPGEITKPGLLSFIKPQYIILKPSLMGGFEACHEWIAAADKNDVDWWATSALESNIGLNAIAQWAFVQENKMVQGLGTGSLYTNNIASPLYVKAGQLYYDVNNAWGDTEDTIL